MKVAITGASGLLGWHTRSALHALAIEGVPIGRAEFADPHRLAAALQDVDAVVHAAGVNRGSDEEVASVNIGLAEHLVAGIKASESRPLVIYLDTIHRDQPTAYGRSKRAAAETFESAACEVLDLVLPGVFGEHGRPFYNSVVSTFCHQLTSGEPLSINDNAELMLVHAQDVAERIVDAVHRRTTGQHVVDGTRITVHGVAARLSAIHERYEAGIVPTTADPFENHALFNTLRSYRFPNRYPTPLDPRTDQRGRLVELVRTDTAGQTFVSATVPGVTRGNHYHRRKVERFVVVDGEATISLRRLFTSGVVTFRVSGRSPVAIDMPTMHAHNITNVGDSSLTTLFWADEIFDPLLPDTVAEEV